MDDRRFDRLAKALAAGASRRRAVRALAGGLAALGGAALGSEPAGAATDTSCEGKPAADNERCAVAESRCTDDSNCFCAITVAGDKRCVALFVPCPKRDECDSGKDCRRGEVCIKYGGCCGHRRRNLCVRRCR